MNPVPPDDSGTPDLKVVVDAKGRFRLQSPREESASGRSEPPEFQVRDRVADADKPVGPWPQVTPSAAAAQVVAEARDMPSVEPAFARRTDSHSARPSSTARTGHSPHHHASDPSPRQRGGRDRHRLRKHFGGWLRSLPDPARQIADTFGIPLRTEVDPRSDLPPIFDQGQLGSCTANAAAAAFEYDAKLDGDLTGRLSRLWIYYQERKLEGSLGDGDTGARGYDAFRVASKIGVPAETYWPYDIAGYQGPPPERAVKDEGFYRLTKRYATPPVNRHSFRQVLSNQQTIAFGFVVFESFESSSVAKSGIVPMPTRGEKVLGGHEVLAVGYLRSEPDYVLVRNSWGSRKTDKRAWGLNGDGYFLMPWKMILDPRICGDWTTIIRPLRRY